VVACTDGRILRVNAAACALAGRSEEELLASTFWELVHPADHAAVGAQHEELRRDGTSATPFRCRVVRPDGSWRWVESSGTYDPEGQLIFSVVRDITGREDLELERLATLFDNAPLGMAVMAPDGTLRRVNRPLAEMLGRTESELLERTIFELVDDEDSRGTLAMALGARPSSSRPGCGAPTATR
jgi:PAS domain S-box-containing protein